MGRRIKYYPPRRSSKKDIESFVLRTVGKLLFWVALSFGLFSFFEIFDTPGERSAKKSTELLGEEYDRLTGRLDTVETVLKNVIERDNSVFYSLFESKPYDLDFQSDIYRRSAYEEMAEHDSKYVFNDIQTRTQQVERDMKKLIIIYNNLRSKITTSSGEINNVPSIQPVINQDLTLLTASYGQRLHPFYKTLTYHQGVDYTVPEGTRVFATADGTVKEILQRRTSTGMRLVISHGNGYETIYQHLSKINVKKGQEVKRGDIIALSGNTGLSLLPHLHYEITLNGMHVDPVHYFFGELTPGEYKRIIKIAQSGMQSFD